MKKILNKHIHFSLMFSLTAICILFASCKSEEITSPVITSVRMYNASPMDTLMSVGNSKTDTLWSGRTGKYVTIIGQNLQNALSIKFNGVAAKFNSALFAPNSVVVPIPDIIFSTIDTTKLYTLEYETTTGSTTFSFKYGPAAPTIVAISDVFANPGDSVYIYGNNLVLVQSFSYGGVPIKSFKPNLTGTALGFKMPSPAPTSGQVSLTTKTGTTNFKIVATPTIIAVSNENAIAGDSVYVYGTYLKSIQSFTFGGANISSYKLSGKGNSIGFILPASPQSGIVSITTAFGTASTLYKVNDTSGSNGVLANMEWSGPFGWGWWGGSNLSVVSNGGWITDCPEMTGNNGMFMSIKDDPLAAGKSNKQIPIGDGQWIPTDNLNDAVGNWAFKFELNIPKPWNGGAITIKSGFTGSYVARFEPWQITSTSTAAYSTKGWITVTIPLTEFRDKDAKLGEGRGISVAKLTDLVGSTGKTGCNVSITNYGTSTTTTGFYGGFDNFRVVKIK
jgi:hypothetical protein